MPFFPSPSSLPSGWQWRHFGLTSGWIEPITTIVGGPELFIGIGSTINLTCVVRHLPEPPSTISWGHKNQVGRHFRFGVVVFSGFSFPSFSIPPSLSPSHFRSPTFSFFLFPQVSFSFFSFFLHFFSFLISLLLFPSLPFSSFLFIRLSSLFLLFPSLSFSSLFSSFSSFLFLPLPSSSYAFPYLSFFFPLFPSIRTHTSLSLFLFHSFFFFPFLFSLSPHILSDHTAHIHPSPTSPYHLSTSHSPNSHSNLFWYPQFTNSQSPSRFYLLSL